MNVDEINSLVNDIHWGSPDHVRQAAMSRLALIDEEHIPMLIMPREKAYWDSAARVLKDIGYPRVKEVLPQLLVWLQDLNWPGSKETAEFLLNIGSPIIPHVHEVLRGSDTEWQYWVLECLVNSWPTNMVSEIQDELLVLARGWDLGGIGIKAIKVLAFNRLWDSQKLSEVYEYKRSVYRDLLDDLNEIEKYFIDNTKR